MSRNWDLLLVAAGRSSRMGFPKALAHISGKLLLHHHFERAVEADVRSIILVVGFHEARIRAQIQTRGLDDLFPLRIVRNPDPEGDMFSSVKVGLHQGNCSGPVFFLPVDIPLQTAGPYKRLLGAPGEYSVRIPTFQGKRGHPPLFADRFVRELREANPPQGIRSLYQDPATDIAEVEVDDPTVLLDLDRPSDLRRIRNQVWNDSGLFL